MTIYFSFLRDKTIYTKLNLETVYISFLSKFIWNHLYLVIILSFIGNRIQQYFLQLYNLNITSMSWATLSENPPGLPAILSCNMTYISFFSVSLSHLKWLLAFSNSHALIALIPWFSFSFCSVIMIGAINSNGNCESMKSHHKIIIWDNVAILLSLFTKFEFGPVLSYYIASYYTHSFCYLNFKCCSTPICLNRSRRFT